MTETLLNVEIETPFPPEVLILVWSWLNEYPEQNFDDYSPQNFEQFVAQMGQRDKLERMWAVKHEGRYVGFMSFAPLTPHVGTFHLCFAREVHGTGVAREAVRQMASALFNQGVEKLQGVYFSDNYQVRKFLKKFKAVDEGYLQSHTMRKGIPIDVRVIALFKGDA